ncbi:MAG TPA: hypothetical protein DC047_08310 [Blastocatellia bacterium]|nr:hypothetical protein [Blastocatellia bacterium]
MTNREIRKRLLEILAISPQALSRRAGKIKERYGPMTTDEATYVIAHMEGIDISRYLDLTTLDRIRALVPRDLSQTLTARTKKARKKNFRTSSYPLVSPAMVSSAVALGAEVFPELFVLENSIRTLIHKRLSTISTDWWQHLVPGDVIRNVRRTMTNEKRFTYREPRGTHELMYSNFADLKKIILSNQSHFADVIVDFDWFKVKMEEIYMARNNVAHCVLLSRDDAARISLFNRDWARMLDIAGEK